MAKTLPTIADLPVRIGIRKLALAFLDQAESARQRMARNRDDEALHDFRVALRRLRSCLRAYRPYFSDTVRGKHRRIVRDLARATGAARDLEVQLAWLTAERDMTPAAAAGARVLVARLTATKRPADWMALRAGHQFPALRDQIEPALSRYCGEVDRVGPPRTVTCAQAAADLAGPALDAWGSALEAIESAEDVQAIHRARIAGKRIRYLFEPYLDAGSGGPALIKAMRRFQDSLGDLHDLGLMLALARSEARAPRRADSDSAAELTALADHIEAEHTAAFERTRSSWLGSRGRKLVQAARAFADSIRPDPESLKDVEIERKYLLRSMPKIPDDAVMLRIDQGYLPGERLVERVRRVRGADWTRHYRTVKLGTGIRRIEIEEETDDATFRALWRLTKGRRISKRRYVVAEGDAKWEIDRFVGRKLVLAEIELADENAEVDPPEWLRRLVVREVTGVAKYLNVNLAG